MGENEGVSGAERVLRGGVAVAPASWSAAVLCRLRGPDEFPIHKKCVRLAVVPMITSFTKGASSVGRGVAMNVCHDYPFYEVRVIHCHASLQGGTELFPLPTDSEPGIRD